MIIPHYEDRPMHWDDQTYYLGFDQDTNLSSYRIAVT